MLRQVQIESEKTFCYSLQVLVLTHRHFVFLIYLVQFSFLSIYTDVPAFITIKRQVEHRYT